MIIFSDIFSFVFHNILTFLLLLWCLTKLDNIKKKMQIFSILTILLFASYFSRNTYNIASVFFVYALNSKIKIRQILATFFALFFVFYSDFRAMFFQLTSGEKKEEYYLNESDTPSIIPHYSDDSILLTKEPFSVIFTPVMDVELVARIVYIDEYDKKFATEDYYSHPLYDALSPLDVTIFIGSMSNNWRKFKIKHERRGAWVVPLNGDASLYKPEECSNVHIIPKNQTIRNGFKTIKNGDIVKIKGFLVDWKGVGEYNSFKVRTARNFADISEQKLGGQTTFLCMQLFVTEIFANGYIFK